jgi:co-chaperonin GroES (HSP10)|tara:strand:- start:1352 stop:1771 length:420 start_codon:yes stop_codon:yes gene_type:complete
MAVENPFDQNIGYQFRLDFEGKTIKPLHNNIIVRDMSFEGRTLDSGIVLLGDDGKTDGIRPRWAKVYAVGPTQTEITVGQWVLLEHGRWSRGIKIAKDGEEFTIRRADPDAIMMVSDEEPNSESIANSVHAERKTRDYA